MLESVCVFGVALLIMLLGLAGAFVPGLPCVPLIWLGACGYGILDKFQHLSVFGLLVLTLFGVLGTTAELWAIQLTARASGASGLATFAGSCLGGLAMLFFGIPVALLVAVASVFGVELWRGRRMWRSDPEKRRKAVASETGRAAQGAGGWLAGWALSAVAQLSIGLFMILFFLWLVLF